MDRLRSMPTRRWTADAASRRSTRPAGRRRAADGHRPLSDHLWLDLVSGGRPRLRRRVACATDGDAPVAGTPRRRAPTRRGRSSWSSPRAPRRPDRHRPRAARRRGRRDRRRRRRPRRTGGSSSRRRRTTRSPRRSGSRPDATCSRCAGRCRSTQPPTIATRPFVPGADEDAWLAVNNRAFAAHPEQGGWTVDTLAPRERRAVVRSRRASSSTSATAGWPASAGRRCTPTHEPPLGEIYVIAVDPDFHGPRPRRAHARRPRPPRRARASRSGMLYVDADNTAAVAPLRARSASPSTAPTAAYVAGDRSP